MKKVGRVKSNVEPRYSPTLLAAIRWSGLAIAALVAAYSAFLYFTPAESPSPFYGNCCLLASTTAFVSLALIQAFVRPASRRSLKIFFVLYYLVSAFYAVTVIGDTPAMYIFAIVLLITTDIIFGFSALIFGAIYTATVMLTFGILYPDPTSGRMVSIIISTVLTLGTVGLLIWLKSARLVRIEVYEQLKSREKLQTRRLETVINSMNDAVISVDDRGMIRLYNSATLGLLDTNSDINGLAVDKLFKLKDEDGKSIPMSDLIGTKKAVERSDLTHTYSDGQKINLYLSISPIRNAFHDDEQHLGDAIIIARDITKQKTLDDERDEFISVVSHELRTPVAIAEGTLSNLQLLVDKGADTKTFAGTLGAAHDQILYLGQMVNDLSTLSRAQRGVLMYPEDVNIEEFMTELYSKYVPEAKKRHLSLDLDLRTSDTINVARMPVEEMMQNLIMNALRYTVKGGVTIGAHRTTENGKPAIELSVRDTGIGISGSDQKHLFQRFWRSEDYRTRETSGTGLGLHVVKQLAEKIGTEVKVKSRLNHGSTFSFRLPAKDAKDKS
ncbi:PAS domain-containing sensor histidine kinase [Candidatus Saccharibacteria bacterium]|nr:PAS domain-containing sensor histidine kinase [Candidatus Saccharibacteria bacterium]